MQTEKSTQLFHFKPIADTGGRRLTGTVDSWEHREISIRPGLWMSLINFTPSDPITLEYEKQFPVIDFGFVLSGNIQKRITDSLDGPEIQQIKGGMSGTRLEIGQSGTFVVPANYAQQLLHLHMTLPLFREMVKDNSQILPNRLREILKGECRTGFTRTVPMAPDIQAVVYQLLNTSSNAYPWSLYLEGKSLELLSLQLAALSMEHRKSPERMLDKNEKERIKNAVGMLVKDLNAPPTLPDLSAMTGLSVAKLQAGFKQVYGMRVFDYFREYRMQKARALLSETRTNVSQTAWEVGYVNVSHFSAAFKKRFGILPKHYLKQHLGAYNHPQTPLSLNLSKNTNY